MPRASRSSSCAVAALLLLGELAVPQAAQVLPQPAVDQTGVSAGSVTPDPVQPRARPTRRLVYSCATPLLITFADRPCGAQPVLRELVVQPGLAPSTGTGPEAAPAAGTPRDATPRERTASSGAAKREDTRPTIDAHAHDEACRTLQSRLDQVDAQMRAGYSASQSGRLWERWREAKQRLRDGRC